MINYATHIYQSDLERYQSDIRALEHDLVQLTEQWIQAQKREQYCKGKVDLIKEQINDIKKYSIGDKIVVPDEK